LQGIHFCLKAKSYFVPDSIKSLKELIEGIKPAAINMFSINMGLKDGEGPSTYGLPTRRVLA